MYLCVYLYVCIHKDGSWELSVFQITSLIGLLPTFSQAEMMSAIGEVCLFLLQPQKFAMLFGC